MQDEEIKTLARSAILIGLQDIKFHSRHYLNIALDRHDYKDIDPIDYENLVDEIEQLLSRRLKKTVNTQD